MDVWLTVPIVVITAVITLVGNGILGYFRNKATLRGIDRNAEVKLEEHRDNLTFQLLRAAKDEVTAARAEVAMFRPLARHLAHFEEAITHIERLILAEEKGELEIARKAAHAFLERVKGLGNLQQVSVSARNLQKDIEGRKTPS